MMSDKRLELYFHIPFCVKKCDYCDFLSAPGSEEQMRRYVDALLLEVSGRAEWYALDTVSTIFIGGGTPSVLPADCIERLLGTVRSHYRLAEDAEVTVEANPGTISDGLLFHLAASGVNRLSIGLQSADDHLLSSIGRIHTWEQFQESFSLARRAGFCNISVDVMSGLPGQSPALYRDTLEKVLGLEQPPEHISAYSLILEEGTRLHDRYTVGGITLPDEEEDRAMYQETKEILAGYGYRRYEISNYAKPGFECRHNSGYWRRENYLGFGLGASSLIDNVRFQNTTDMGRYLKAPLECRENVCALSRKEQMEEFMFLGLRMTDGVASGEFEAAFGCSLEEVYGEVIRKNMADGLLWQKTSTQKKDGAGEERLALTDYGLDVSNYVMAQFLLDE